ncbi:hypothetical protein CKO21_09890 [Rhodovibrio salinarum]|uniref:Uncharacterized protein n=1 Tax=Rhodovibrio salinarum TaxID=1087 RepID=A0A934QIS5_9PROT|nr:hypothetical protein [Rhodovibrio salinarum]
MLSLAVLMAVYDQPLGGAAVRDRMQRLAAPGFDADSAWIDDAIAGLHAAGYLDSDVDEVGREVWRINAMGRDLASELGGRAPGQACDATRTCLLLRLCLDGTMPAHNRRIFVASLLSRNAGSGAQGSEKSPANR